MSWLHKFVGSLAKIRYRGDPLKVGYHPYSDRACNLLYNLLFCDKPKLLAKEAGKPPQGHWAMLLAEEPYVDGLTALADDPKQPSRLRAIAYRRLHEAGRAVPKGIVLGVIVELGMHEGLDVLAAYADGYVRYINHKESIVSFDPAPSAWIAKVRRLLNASQSAVQRIGPWLQPRVAPPSAGTIRMTFLVSDGLYFGQGPMVVMENDDLAAPIIAASVDLMKSVTQTSAKVST